VGEQLRSVLSDMSVDVVSFFALRHSVTMPCSSYVLLGLVLPNLNARSASDVRAINIDLFVWDRLFLLWLQSYYAWQSDSFFFDKGNIY
jgi:hypothetical protein